MNHPFIDSEHIEPSIPLGEKKYLVCHLMNTKRLTDEQERLNFFQSFDFHFISLVFIFRILYAVISIQLRTVLRQQIQQTEESTRYKTQSQTNSKLRIAELGLIFFGFFVKFLLTNNVKTSKVSGMLKLATFKQTKN